MDKSHSKQSEIANGTADNFPTMEGVQWRSESPHIITLSDGSVTTAYAIAGQIDESIGLVTHAAERGDGRLWLVMDIFLESELIKHIEGQRVLKPEQVTLWEPLVSSTA